MLMIGKQLTAEQRLHRAVIDILNEPRYVALAGVLILGKRSVDDATPTARTNGRDEVYGRAFIESMNDAELRFVVLHETYHKLYRHLSTWAHLYEDDADTANRACDYVINIKIADENTDGFATMPMRDGKMVGLLDPQYRGMDTAQVFHKLKREQQQQQSAGQSGQQQQQQSAGQSGKGAGQQGAMDEHDWEGAKSMTEEERKGLARDIDEALRQGAIAAGKLGSGGARDFQDLLQPKIDWREVLREFVKTTCTGNEFSTWRRPNRRYIGMNVYLPSGVSEQVGELVIAIDTSGSIGGAELSRFLGEVSGICQTVKPSAVRLLYWDTRVVQDEKYVGDDVADIVKTTKPAGGGGTNVTCVPNHMHKHSIKPQAVVVLTDGLLGGRWGTWQVPVLWCIVGSTASAPVGKTVHVRD